MSWGQVARDTTNIQGWEDGTRKASEGRHFEFTDEKVSPGGDQPLQWEQTTKAHGIFEALQMVAQ